MAMSDISPRNRSPPSVELVAVAVPVANFVGLGEVARGACVKPPGVSC